MGGSSLSDVEGADDRGEEGGMAFSASGVDSITARDLLPPYVRRFFLDWIMIEGWTTSTDANWQVCRVNRVSRMKE